LAIEDECVREGVVPIVYSHKGALGAFAGAAGLVSVVLNCLMHRHGHIPRNAQLDSPIPTRLRLARENHAATIKRSIAVAAGFRRGTRGGYSCQFMSVRIILLLALATLAVYWPVLGHDFVGVDDNAMIVRNPNLNPPPCRACCITGRARHGRSTCP
jgi:hypothetical protein